MQKQELTSVCDYTKLQKSVTKGKRQKHPTDLVVYIHHKLFLQCSSIYSVLKSYTAIFHRLLSN